MNIVEHGTRGSHRGRSDGPKDLVVHHRGGKVELTEGKAYELCYELLKYLNEVEE